MKPALSRQRFSGLSKLASLAAACVLVAASYGCAVTLISRYDEQIDKSATSLQQKMDAFLTGLEYARPQPTFEASQQFYQDYEVRVRSVLIRAQSHPKNELSEKQLELMLDSLAHLKELHQVGPLDTATIRATRDLFNESWRAIITLEVAKKRGET
jgi:hypothetical protein